MERKLLNPEKHDILAKLCRGAGFSEGLRKVTSEDLVIFECTSIQELEELVLSAVSAMREMVGIETETLAIECALALDGGTATNLSGRREEFLFTETFSMRTLMRKEDRGIDLIVTTMSRVRSKRTA